MINEVRVLYYKHLYKLYQIFYFYPPSSFQHFSSNRYILFRASNSNAKIAVNYRDTTIKQTSLGVRTR